MCTTLIFTKGAMADGSMVVTHSDDDELGDQTIVRVPSQDHAPGATRDIFCEHYLHPRIVTSERGPGYQEPGDTVPSWAKPLGSIPQPAHTHAYFDGNYGIMNEHNLMIGECTNGTKYEPEAVSTREAHERGVHSRMLYSQELSRIALERCVSARDAVLVMGSLIEEYGLYSTGETLLVADEDEAWVFEMCALPDDTYHSAWVAQQVPDGEIFVAANEFRIRGVWSNDPAIPNPPGNRPEQLYSKFLFPGLQKLGWWDPTTNQGFLDWLRAVSMGEYNHPYYSLRRVWRVLDRVNPDLALSPWVTRGYSDPGDGGYATDYPFSVRPARPLHLEEVFDLYRDHYEGTQFDLTKGVAAGPYGDPHRFAGPYDGAQNDVGGQLHRSGAWERPISVFYQGYTFVNQIRPGAPEANKGLCWFGPDISKTTCFVPFSSKMTSLPNAYQTGNPKRYDRTSAWWTFDFVANWARLNYERMTRVDIVPLQRDLEREGAKVVTACDVACGDIEGAAAFAQVTKAYCEHADSVLESWQNLGDQLIAKYSDGYCNPDDGVSPHAVGYNAEWLAQTNYREGPVAYRMPS
jgi:dipeptidase